MFRNYLYNYIRVAYIRGREHCQDIRRGSWLIVCKLGCSSHVCIVLCCFTLYAWWSVVRLSL